MKIKVTQLLASGAGGGAQVHVQNLVERLDHDRFDVDVIALSDGPAIRRIRAAGATVHVIDEADDAAALDAVLALIADGRADIVHNHMYRAEIIGTRAALALDELGRRRPFVVSTVHSSRVRSQEDQALLRRLTPSMDRLIAVSRAIVGKLVAEGRIGAPIDLIYNGIDLSRYEPVRAVARSESALGVPNGAKLVGVVARLEPEKGHRTLLEAWPYVLAAVPEAHLLIVGEGSQREMLECQAACLGLSGQGQAATVTFTGLRDDVPAVTAAFDVAVLPSYREAQGLAILEAMALRRPVVATRVGGVPEMVEHERTGLLVPPRDPAALADGIIRLLTDGALANSVAFAGYDLVHDRFSLDAMIRAVTAIYDEAASVVAQRSEATQTAA